ncbi:MAG: histidine kinase [Bacteroidota bacterium]|nr:histidine kinase [Bacteroidota bacterium]
MKTNFIYHILFWLGVYLLWVFVFRNYSFSLTKTISVEFCYLLFITADYYAIIYFITPRFLKKKNYVYFIVCSAVLIALSALLRAIIARQMNIHVFTGNSHPAFVRIYLDSLVNIFIWVELIIIGKMIADRIYNQQQLALLEKERVKHELDFLKAQINPHALFNSLNTIYGHIDKQNQAARNILLKFSGLLRYQLYDCSEDNIRLEKEIEYIRNYISFQQIRKDEHLQVNIEIDAEPGNYTIAPLLLVVVVENAFKFVSSFTDRENVICIKLDVTGNQFTFRIYNTTEHRQAAPAVVNSGGIGIVNLKRRLELLYPGKYEFYFKAGENDYETTLKLQLA